MPKIRMLFERKPKLLGKVYEVDDHEASARVSMGEAELVSDDTAAEAPAQQALPGTETADAPPAENASDPSAPQKSGT